MIFTKEEILLESNYINDFYRISVASDLMIESFLSEETEDYLTEATLEKIGQTVTSAITTLAEKIKELIRKGIDTIRIQIAKTKYKELLTPEKIQILYHARNQEVVGVDLEKVVIYARKLNEFGLKFLTELNDKLSDYIENPSEKKREKLELFMESGHKTLKELTAKVDAAKNYKVPLSVKQIINGAKELDYVEKHGDEWNKVVSDIQKMEVLVSEKMKAAGFEKKVRAYKKEMTKESADSYNETKVYPYQKAKQTVMKSLNCIHDFVIEHNKVFDTVLRCVQYYCTAVSSLNLAAAGVKISSTERDLKYVRSKVPNANVKLDAKKLTKNNIRIATASGALAAASKAGRKYIEKEKEKASK